jgi:hypothetical protein
LPGLSAQLRRYGEAIGTIAQSGAALAGRIAQMARRHSKGQTAELYWGNVAARGTPQPKHVVDQVLAKQSGQSL